MENPSLLHVTKEKNVSHAGGVETYINRMKQKAKKQKTKKGVKHDDCANFLSL